MKPKISKINEIHSKEASELKGSYWDMNFNGI